MDTLDNPVGATLALMRRHPGALLAICAPWIIANWAFMFASASQAPFVINPAAVNPLAQAAIDWPPVLAGILLTIAVSMVDFVVGAVLCVWFASALTEDPPIRVAGAWSITGRALPAVLGGGLLLSILFGLPVWLPLLASTVSPALLCGTPVVMGLTWFVSLRLAFFAPEIVLAQRRLPESLRASWRLTRDRLLRIVGYCLRLAFRLWPFVLLQLVATVARIRWGRPASPPVPVPIDSIELAWMAASAVAAGVLAIGFFGLTTMLWFKFQATGPLDPVDRPADPDPRPAPVRRRPRRSAGGHRRGVRRIDGAREA